MDDLKEILDCPICLSTFTDPVILQCQHTFCKECVRALLRNQIISCPVCRAKHTNLSSVDTLPRNLIAINFIDKLSGQPRPSREHVHPCDSMDDKQATVWCDSCETFLCDDCWKIAHSVGKLKMHTPIPAVDADLHVKPVQCSSHVRHPREYYCSTCNDAICSICWIDNHKDHEVASVFKTIEAIKVELLDKCESIVRDRPQLTSLVNEEKRKKDQIAQELEQLETKVIQMRALLEQSEANITQIQEKDNQIQAAYQMIKHTVEQNAVGLAFLDKGKIAHLESEISSVYKEIYNNLIHEPSDIVMPAHSLSECRLSLNSQSFVGDQNSYSLENLSFTKKTAGHCAISSTESFSSGCYVLEFSCQPIDSQGWLLVGIQTQPKASSAHSFNDKDVTGLNITKSGTNNGKYRLGKHDSVGSLNYVNGETMKLSLNFDSCSLTLRAMQSGWQMDVDFPKAPQYYIHFNPYSVSFSIKKFYRNGK
jgi:hypothetical protein